MTEKGDYGELLNYVFDPEQNLKTWEAETDQIETELTPYFRQYAQLAPLTHATSLEGLALTLKAGSIKPHAMLVKEGSSSVADRMQIQTDQLDIDLGLDQFTFWDLGRAHTETGAYGGYLIADNSLLDEGLISFQEIADLGGIVSPEGAAEYKRVEGLTDQQIEEQNRQAAQSFFNGLFEGRIFREVFAKYLSNNHENVSSYLSMWDYHLGKLDNLQRVHKATGQLAIRCAWQGPQLIVPGQVKMDRVKAILLSDFNGVTISQEEEKNIRELAKPHGLMVKRFSETAREDLAASSEMEIVTALKNGRPEAAIHTILNFVLNTLGGAIISAEQEREILSGSSD